MAASDLCRRATIYGGEEGSGDMDVIYAYGEGERSSNWVDLGRRDKI